MGILLRSKAPAIAEQYQCNGKPSDAARGTAAPTAIRQLELVCDVQGEFAQTAMMFVLASVLEFKSCSSLHLG